MFYLFILRYSKVLSDKASTDSPRTQWKNTSCSKSLFRTDNVSVLNTHGSVHAPNGETFQCSSQTFNKESFSRHHNAHKTKQPPTFTCDICSFTTKYKSALQVHLKIHDDDGAKEFACSSCPYQTNSRSAIGRHRNIHDPQREQKFGSATCSYKTPLPETSTS